jgi:hypothetical protein
MFGEMFVLAVDITERPNWVVVRMDAGSSQASVLAFGSADSPRTLHSVLSEQEQKFEIDSLAHPVMPQRDTDGTNYKHPFQPSSPRDEYGFEVASLIAGIIHAEAIFLGLPVDYVSVFDVHNAVMQDHYTDAARRHFVEFKGDSRQAFIALVGFLAARQRLASILARG